METPAKPFSKTDALLYAAFVLLGSALFFWFFIEATNAPSHVTTTTSPASSR